MNNLGRAGRSGQFYDVRLTEEEMIRLYTLSVIREGGCYGGVQFPSLYAGLQFHEMIAALFPHVADLAVEKMSQLTLTAEEVKQGLIRLLGEL